ncbi:hypothetical protein [Nocardia salmonicida]|uniref:hypothetical protein n=1 Tax=Nocardia salmonicida TaxID=53431 RepID=UPI003CFB047F
MDQVTHHRRPIADDGRVAHEPCYARIVTNCHPVAHVSTMDNPGSVADPTSISQPDSVLDHAVDTESAALMNDHLIENQGSGAD